MKDTVVGLVVAAKGVDPDMQMGRTRGPMIPVQAMQAEEKPDAVSLRDLMDQYDELENKSPGSPARRGLEAHIRQQVKLRQARLKNNTGTLMPATVTDLALFSSWFCVRGGW